MTKLRLDSIPRGRSKVTIVNIASLFYWRTEFIRETHMNNGLAIEWGLQYFPLDEMSN